MRISLILFVGLFLGPCFLGHAKSTAPTEHYVFVHGTFFPGTSMLTNPIDVCSQYIKTNCCYRQTLAELRKNPCYYESQIIFELGMHEIEIKKLPEKRHLAPFQIANAFEQLFGDKKLRKYYAYGWSGELSLQGRSESAAELYQELTKIMTSPHDTLIIIGHSHGGNVVAYLAAEEKKHKRGLSVAEAYLLAVPIQSETAHLFAEPFFHNVYSLYSAKDIIQVGDTISVPSRSSHRKLSKFIKMTKRNGHILDIELQAHQKSLFGHRVFFYFNQLRVPAFEPFFARHHYTLNQLSPLPLVAIVPMLKTLWPKIPNNVHQLTVNLHSSGRQDWRLRAVGPHECYTTSSYTDILQQLKEKLETEWLPVAYTNEVMKNLSAAGTALKHRVGLGEDTVVYTVS